MDRKRVTSKYIYPYMTNGFTHGNHFGESSFILGQSGVVLYFHLLFLMHFL